MTDTEIKDFKWFNEIVLHIEKPSSIMNVEWKDEDIYQATLTLEGVPIWDYQYNPVNGKWTLTLGINRQFTGDSIEQVYAEAYF